MLIHCVFPEKGFWIMVLLGFSKLKFECHGDRDSCMFHLHTALLSMFKFIVSQPACALYAVMLHNVFAASV